jgi:hypothetical protein
MTPAMVHHGQAPHILALRQVVLDAAYSAHPERFVRKPPRPPELPSQVWINKPPPEEKNSLNSQARCLILVDTYRPSPDLVYAFTDGEIWMIDTYPFQVIRQPFSSMKRLSQRAWSDVRRCCMSGSKLTARSVGSLVWKGLTAAL